ncbi:MAG: RNA-binding protein [Propylenella sp.]
MPRGPKGEKRPADVIGNAVRIMEIATGQREEEYEGKPESAAAELGRKGGKARAEKLSKKRRAEIARKAATTRWRS